MFSLFKRKVPLQPTVTPDDKKWIEENFDWLIKAFSFAKARDLPFILPIYKAASSGKANATDQLQVMLENLCKRWDIDPTSVVLKTFNDLPPKKWYSPFVPANDNYEGPAGIYQHQFEGTTKKYHIHLAQSILKHNDITTATLTHELAHAKLLGEEYLPEHAPDMEPLTDLACIYFGFGIFLANTCYTDRGSMMRMGYLPNPMISYANALLCYITGFDPADVIVFLNSNTRELFKQDYNYLITTNDTLLTKAQIQKSDQLFHDYKKITQAWKEKNFDFLIETANNLLYKYVDDEFLLNYIGYAYIEKKQYHAAIEAFTKAIDAAPHWDHPYNNRGYCRLLLGDTDAAYPDLQRAMEISDGNSYTWRHLGIYHMLKNDLPKALEHLEQSEKIEPRTWTINYYLGLAHQRLGNTEKAGEYFTISKDREEPIDSIFSENNQL